MSSARLITRRRFSQGLLAWGGAALLTPRRGLAAAKTQTPLHGLSAFGELKYGPDYQAFDYASPDAPDGGQMNLSVPNWVFNQSPLTFDTLNTFVLKGNAPPRIEMLYDSLMTPALDEPASFYGALAESVTISADRNGFTFRLRPEARFSTGEPVTAGDVAFSYLTFKAKGHPSLSLSLADLAAATAEDSRTVRLSFNGRQSDQTVFDTLLFPIVRKSFFDGRDFETADLTPITGSGRYKVGRSEPGRYIEYQRREDYWAAGLPFARGLDHFRTIRIDFFRDRQAAFEAFKKGAITYREEFVAKSWATEYGFPAIATKKVVKRLFPGELTPKFQCWALNQRRPRFADAGVRKAINLCFDFKWTNANMFYGQYAHSDSCFEHSAFKAAGRPREDELAILEPLRGKIPDEVFGDVWVQPTTDGSGFDRRNLRIASQLLANAGWTRQGNRLVNKAGEVFTFEYLIDDPGFERVYGKFVETLRLLGIDARFRLVDAAQYQDRQSRFDFDMIGAAFSIGSTPTRDGLQLLFGSATAGREGSHNYPGMADPAVDSLIETVSGSRSRKELEVAMRCLDRVLRARLDWIPNINSADHRVAYWDMFGFKEKKPDYGFPVESLWWLDAAKAKAIGKA